MVAQPDLGLSDVGEVFLQIGVPAADEQQVGGGAFEGGGGRELLPFFHAAGGLALVNIALAVFW